MYKIKCFICIAFFLTLPLIAAEFLGERPYEMVNAGRTADAHPPLIDFTNLDGWTVETTVGAEATFTLSREQLLWGDAVAKLTYKNTPDEQGIPVVTLSPPKPIPISVPFDCVNFWVYGNNWAWETDVTTPRVNVILRLQGKNGILQTLVQVVQWKEWFLIHKKFSEEDLAAIGDEPTLVNIQIQQGRNTEPRTLYFSNLSFFKEQLPPLEFEPRPLRNIKLPDGQTTGTNTGPGTLPFPNREETILPTNLAKQYRNEHRPATYIVGSEKRDSYYFSYEGPDGTLFWLYKPETGTLGDLTVAWKAAEINSMVQSFRLENSGLTFVEEKTEQKPTLLTIEWQGDTLSAWWKFGDDVVEYRFTMKQKSLIVDVRCPGGNVKEFSSGGWTGLENAKLVKVPYLVGNGTLRPAVIACETKLGPLFMLSMLDHTRSNASEFFWENKTDKDYASAAACCRYKPKTDGNRNDVFERLFITVSPVFEETLPNIPNDPSPWRHVTAERVWRSHGASNHDYDYEYWCRIKRYGMEKVLITDHETLWRDGGESFTFRTYAAPGKGGDEGQKEYTRKIHGLGYIYGPYNNYTDYSPVNEFWNPDWVTRLSDGNYQPAWARCYNPKPAIAVQMEPKITEIIQQKFGFNTAYCDVHTAVSPWQYVDYDTRVPGAGTLAATFYAYGEIMLHQKKIWNGPVYSEGNNHWYYSGLTDGNYAQDQAYFVYDNEMPWIVDFDLLKIHPLENNFGMGMPSMFYGEGRRYADSEERGRASDRFLAATLAFGHTGFLEYGLVDEAARSYFTVQQIAARYGTQNVKSIHYADAAGKFLTTSQAIAADAVKLNRIKVEYEDGLTIYVNGDQTKTWNTEPGPVVPTNEIPPHGWYVVDPAKQLTAWSLDRDGCRTDYIDSPAYLFANVRGNPPGKPQRFDRLLCDRQMIVRKNIDERGRWEMIVGEPNYASRSTLHAVRLDTDADADAIALDFHGAEIGKAETRYSRGMVHVLPVEGAFSYLLTPKKADEQSILHSNQIQVPPGDRVEVSYLGHFYPDSLIPHDAKPGTLFWHEASRYLLDFEIVSPYEVSTTYATDKLEFTVSSNYRQSRKVQVELLYDGKTKIDETVEMQPGKPFHLTLNLDPLMEPKTSPVKLRMTTFYLLEEFVFEKEYRLVTELGFPELEKFPDRFESGYCFRNGQETAMDETTGAHAYAQVVEAGGKSQKGWGIHPPYMGGTGYTFMLSEPIIVPKTENLVFAMDVGIRSGGDKSDGVLYKIQVVDDEREPGSPNTEPGPVVPVSEILWDKKSWGTLQADLSPWAGKTVRLKLIADVGPNDDSTADWACIANIRWETTKMVLMTRLEEVEP